MDDATTTVKQLKDAIAQFADERDWNQFHSPKNLSMSIAIEAAELMEHFQWISQEESRKLDDAKRLDVKEELADVVCYCLALANSMNIDLSESFEHKMARNREKYPAEEFKGIYGHDDPARGA
jgi:NTP pyrophosphatase (non-canonical NTP hydrolase)